jgi:hypothetical protein
MLSGNQVKLTKEALNMPLQKTLESIQKANMKLMKRPIDPDKL